MSAEENKAIIRRFWEEVFNGRNLNLITSFTPKIGFTMGLLVKRHMARRVSNNISPCTSKPSLTFMQRLRIFLLKEIGWEAVPYAVEHIKVN